MSKIAVLNCSHIINFGSVLQSYATEKIVRDLTGADVYSIRYRQKKNFSYIKNYLPLLLNKEIVSFKLKGVKRKLFLKYKNKNLGAKCKIRENYFENFTKSHFNYSDIYTSWSDLENAAQGYSCVILGSDQVWHPINFGSHYYTMEWVPDSVPKITYAASFGVSQIPKNQEKGTRAFLSRINSVSVREKKGAEIIKKMTGREVSIVADPTFLLSRSEWENVSAPVKEQEDYIFCYFLGDNTDARKYAINIKNSTGLKIKCIPFMDEIIKNDFEFGDEQLYEVGPAEFISYIKCAKYVITDSFHGTVFSLIFHKKFMTFNRYNNNNNKGSTNSRIDTLLDIVGLQNNRYSINSNNNIDKDIDYSAVDKSIEKLKKQSICYLKKSLKTYGVI